MLFIELFVRALRAYLQARTAAYALRWEDLKLRSGPERFRIVAPVATQVAAFQEHRSTDSRPIVDREALYFADDSFHGEPWLAC
jgi:hypothetical protein